MVLFYNYEYGGERMKTKRGLRLVSFLMALVLLSGVVPYYDAKAASGTMVTITTEGQVVDTFNGVSSLYRPGSWDGTDMTYGCHAYVIRYYQAIYGRTVYNLFHNQTPLTYGDVFVTVTSPQPGDICAQVKASSNHWSIVKSVKGSTVTVIDQNNKWTVGDVTYAYKNYTYNTSEVTFFRLSSVAAGATAVTSSTPTATTTAPAATTAVPATTQAQVASSATMTVNKGKKKRITDAVLPNLSLNPAVSWKSSKKKVAKVSAKGYVTGVKKGTAKITGTLSDGQRVTVKVNVKVPTKSLKLVSKDVTLGMNTSWKLTATVSPKTTTDVLKFSSSDPSIATVSSNGTVQTYGVRGMTKITVKSGSKKKTCIVRVY